MDDTPELDDIVKDNITSGEDTYNGLIGSEIHMPGHDGSFTRGKVIKGVKGNDGKAIVPHHDNPLVDTSEYKIELENGSSAQYTANFIAENIFSQADSEGNRYNITSEITDHAKDDSATKQSDGYIQSKMVKINPELQLTGGSCS